MENNLIVFIIKPKEIGFFGLAMFSHPHSHSGFWCLFESVFFSLNQLFIDESTLIVFFLTFQFFLIIGDYFELLSQILRNWSYIEYVRFLFFLGFTKEVYILHLRKSIVRYQSGRVIVSHSNHIWIQKIRDTKFRIFFIVGDPDIRGCLNLSYR